ncbi:MAG: hypothetical protein A2381_05350 [Bdellovibrionales bacterium RIFOXYB1_FULL_37_110]|nr:MAG: hypothetical protein A2417_16830 [Bdellovibrionales bacterium RIFOXYC1_FULL_37_79]OFZ58172.1 MAG: hypothetical protein A2381_05350 [Bdellovibrionales bacterium RIFOXYB1_FULL_37_110]OFZ61861.1 MAG: hypothetical protein A2577_18935 [Bdellovibrionales bacterium RIFOXYD1_FULL_36_51]
MNLFNVKTLLGLCWFFSLAISAVDSIDINERLQLRNELTLITQKIRPFLIDWQVKERLGNWLNHPVNNSYIVECQFKLRAFFETEQVLGPLCYFLRQDDKQMRLNYFDFIQKQILETKQALLELQNDPRYEEEFKNNGKVNFNLKAQNYLKVFRSSYDPLKIKNCFGPVLKADWDKIIKNDQLTFSPFQQTVTCLRELPEISTKNGNKPYFALNLKHEFINHPGHAISDTGWIPGNLVQYFDKNDYSSTLINTLGKKHELLPDLYPVNEAGSIESFFSQDPLKVLTHDEGFFSMENDPVWGQKNGIFAEIKKSLDAATDTIFVDIFFLGGTMGVTFAKYLVTRLEDPSSQLKVFILRDLLNHYGHDKQMLPVYNYLYAYSQKFPQRLIIAPAHINKHKSGLPKYVGNIISEEFVAKSGLQQHLSLYANAKSDHSKVIVIDAKTDHPMAWVGSKNLVDASGAVCYDDMTKVTGPAASIIQDDYYFDMFYALKEEISDQDLKNIAQKLNLPHSNEAELIAQILAPFDLLNRSGDGTATNKQAINRTYQGTSLVRIGLNNFDSTRTSAIDQVLQGIQFAQKSIFIKDQYLFDRNIVLALINAKNNNPDLDVRIILDPLPESPIVGFPNILYSDVLKKAGIPTKFKTIINDDLIRQEFHYKTISMDGKYLITGSANKDQTTMYGAFREEQLDLAHSDAALIHDREFLKYWNDSDETSAEFTDFDFQVPLGIKLDNQQFISLVRDLISILYDHVAQ